MAQTPSTMMLPLGSDIPRFSLTDVKGAAISSADLAAAPAALVMFICNHCPFVKHVRSELAKIGREYAARGVAIVALNSNDADSYPDDSPEMMLHELKEAGYSFPYAFDADQSVAKAFKASCTPDFFVFARGKGLTYRGQLDDSRPVKEGTPRPLTGRDLRTALDAALAGKDPLQDQKPSIGCNIKWKPGAAPSYLTSSA